MATVYTGIMDAHGIESFYAKDSVSDGQLFRTQMRASLNRQRHALVYEVELDDEQAKVINEMLQENKYFEAAELLHDPDFLEDYGCEPEMMTSWQLIPNHKLDPYY